VTKAERNQKLFSGSSSRSSSTTTTPTRLDSSATEAVAKLVKSDLANMHRDIRHMFRTDRPQLKEICDYYFDGSGKAIRPLIICTWARAINKHLASDNDKEVDSQILQCQRQLSLISEMIHVSSLIHDDIIDNSDLRRGKTSVNSKWGCDKAVMAGNYVLAVSSRSLAQLGKFV
jgi:decaprenyl-diphosphate synthase subunit 1